MKHSTFRSRKPGAQKHLFRMIAESKHAVKANSSRRSRWWTEYRQAVQA